MTCSRLQWLLLGALCGCMLTRSAELGSDQPSTAGVRDDSDAARDAGLAHDARVQQRDAVNSSVAEPREDDDGDDGRGSDESDADDGSAESSDDDVDADLHEDAGDERDAALVSPLAADAASGRVAAGDAARPDAQTATQDAGSLDASRDAGQPSNPICRIEPWHCQ